MFVLSFLHVKPPPAKELSLYGFGMVIFLSSQPASVILVIASLVRSRPPFYSTHNTVIFDLAITIPGAVTKGTTGGSLEQSSRQHEVD
jgi:hypothetical protein